MSDGYCEVDFTDASDDAEPCEFVNTRFVVARKEHKCSSCGGPIARGERHRVSAYRFEGEFGMERMCDACHEAAGEFGYNLLGGDLWGMFADEWDSDVGLVR